MHIKLTYHGHNAYAIKALCEARGISNPTEWVRQTVQAAINAWQIEYAEHQRALGHKGPVTLPVDPDDPGNHYSRKTINPDPPPPADSLPAPQVQRAPSSVDYKLWLGMTEEEFAAGCLELKQDWYANRPIHERDRHLLLVELGRFCEANPDEPLPAHLFDPDEAPKP